MSGVELRRLVPAEGYTLFDGETLSKEVYLGIHDSPDRWREVTDEEAATLEKSLVDAEEADYLAALDKLGVSADD